jgi:hypothetical protein
MMGSHVKEGCFMSSVAMQIQPVAPHLLQGNMAWSSSPSHQPSGGMQMDPQIMQMFSELMGMVMQNMMQSIMQTMMQMMMQNQGAGGEAGAGGGGGGGGGASAWPAEQNPFSSSNPAGCGGGAPASAGAPEGVGAPSGVVANEQSATASASGPEVVASSSGTAGAGKAPVGMPAEQWEGCVEAGQKMGIDPYILAAQAKQESQFGADLTGTSPSAGDGVMQVEPNTRQAYAGKFEEKMGHSYDHSNVKDQIAMAAVILADKGGSEANMLQKYNGGDNWVPGTTDSYNRPILADQYAAKVSASAAQMRAGG